MNTVCGIGLDVTAFAATVDDEIKVSLRLSSNASRTENREPAVRVVVLIDTSGSMLHYSDRRTKRSKIQVVRNFCRVLTDVLGQGDSVAIVSFAENASVLLKMSRIDEDIRARLTAAIEATTCHGGSTDLSSGVAEAFRQFATDRREGDPTHDIIVILTDGDINAGIVDVGEMNQFVKNQIDLHDNPVTLVTVKTGGTMSDIIISLCEKFGSHAYIYLDGRADIPEIGMILPVISHQYSTAFHAAITVTAHQGVRIDWRKCSQAYIRRHYTQQYPCRINMRLHHIGQMTSRNMGIVLVPGMNYGELAINVVIMDVDIDYFDKTLKQRSLKISLTKGDIDKHVYACKIASAINDIKERVVESLASAAEAVRNENGDQSLKLLEQCHVDMEKMAGIATGENPAVNAFVDMIKERVVDLKRTIIHSRQGTGHKWNKIVALKSAVDRETIGLPETVETIVSNHKQEHGNKNVGEELDECDKISLCMAMIKQVTSKLATLTQSITTGHKIEPDTRPPAIDRSDSTAGGFSRLKTAKSRLTMSKYLNNLLELASTNDEQSVAGSKPYDGASELEKMIDDLVQGGENSKKITVSPKNSCENWVTGDTTVNANKNCVVKHNYENWPQSGVDHKVETKTVGESLSTVATEDLTIYAPIKHQVMPNKPLESNSRKSQKLKYISVEVVKKENEISIQFSK